MIDKVFVGRKNILSDINDWLQKTGSRLILITGSGGIGKTSLLSKIATDCSSMGCFVVEYFDLAEQPLTTINQAIHLADSLGRENFPKFMHKLAHLDISAEDEIANNFEGEAIETYLSEVDTYLKSHQKKLLYIIDTYEVIGKYRLYGNEWTAGINEYLRRIPDTVFVIAGREKLEENNLFDDVYPQLIDIFKQENVLHIPLCGFDQVEIDDFFLECDKHHIIPQEMRKKLHLLTEGRPILLSLAVEWLHSNIPLPIMIDQSLTELEEILSEESARLEILSKFEFELISRVRQLQSPLDRATLYMAQIDRRTDSRLLSVLLDIEMDQAEENWKKISKLPFVKEFIGSNPPKCALHDEMSVLVKKHAWQYLDIGGEDRKRLTIKTIDHYYVPYVLSLKQQLDAPTNLLQDVEDKINNWERWLLEAEIVYYSTKLGEDESFRYFDQLFYDNEDNPIRDRFLLDELRKAGLSRNKVNLREADSVWRCSRKAEVARDICLAVLDAEDIEDADRIHSYMTLGTINWESDPLAADKYFQQALELSKSQEDLHLQGMLYNNLGRLYKNMSQLEKAISHFDQALIYMHEAGDPDIGAAIRNNLASTYRLNGNLDEADALCSLSIAEHRKLGQERPLAYAYLTKADIEREKSELQNAEMYARRALNIFKKLKDRKGEAQAYRTLANIYRYLHKFEQALKYLKRGILLVESESRNSLSLLASLYQLYGRLCRHYSTFIKEEMELQGNNSFNEIPALYHDSRFALQESVSLAQKAGNRWEVARSQIEIALIMLIGDDPLNTTELNELLDQVWQTANDLGDELLMGYVYENRARLAMKNKKYIEAGRMIGYVARHISRRTGHESLRAFSRLHKLLLDDELSPVDRDALAVGVLQTLTRQDCHGHPALIALINMCEQILALPKL